MIGLNILRMSDEGVLYGLARSNDKQSHQGSYSFYKIDREEGKVEKVQTQDIFLPTVQRRVFTKNGKFIFTALDAAFMKVFSFDLKTRKLEILKPEDVSQTVLDVYENYILVNRSSSTNTPELWLGKVSDDNQVNWVQICKPNSFDVQHTCIDVDEHSFLIMPRQVPEGDGTVPLVAILHGGPHGASIKSWGSRLVPMLTQLGCAVLQINYPGSLGYDDNYVQQLPGKVGDMDVKYCAGKIDEVVAKFKQLNGHKIAIFGGSHGGFLVSHLAGKYPDKFKAIIALNPVLNIRTGEANAEMVAKSPIATVHKIRSPFLLIIGGKDLRVAPHFRTFLRELRINGVTNKVLYYPESNHALEEVEVDADLQINTILWIKEHLGLEK
uniref:Peptidase S9 prolyl oligopeptidase catalytic domain-containing protein n=1 Tax=Panagrolaimus sp. JU765 TaxID=591449 RepID=A0AC34QTQ3_9BILA